MNKADADRISRADTLKAEKNKFDTAADPTITANTRYAAGQFAESQGDVANALNQYNDALRLDPKHAPTLYRLGQLYSQKKQFPQAIDAWTKYIQATNDAGAGYSNLGFCWELAGKPADAEAAYKKGIAREPRGQPCRVNYGLMLARQGKLEAAAEQFGAVLTPGEVHYNIASVLEAQGKKPQAKEEYRKALQLNPAMTDAQARLAALD